MTYIPALVQPSSAYGAPVPPVVAAAAAVAGAGGLRAAGRNSSACRCQPDAVKGWNRS